MKMNEVNTILLNAESFSTTRWRHWRLAGLGVPGIYSFPQHRIERFCSCFLFTNKVEKEVTHKILPSRAFVEVLSPPVCPGSRPAVFSRPLNPRLSPQGLFQSKLIHSSNSTLYSVAHLTYLVATRAISNRKSTANILCQVL